QVVLQPGREAAQPQRVLLRAANRPGLIDVKSRDWQRQEERGGSGKGPCSQFHDAAKPHPGTENSTENTLTPAPFQQLTLFEIDITACERAQKRLPSSA